QRDGARGHPQAPESARGPEEGLLLELPQAAARAVGQLPVLWREAVSRRYGVPPEPTFPKGTAFGEEGPRRHRGTEHTEAHRGKIPSTFSVTSVASLGWERPVNPQSLRDFAQSVD